MKRLNSLWLLAVMWVAGCTVTDAVSLNDMGEHCPGVNELNRCKRNEQCADNKCIPLNELCAEGLEHANEWGYCLRGYKCNDTQTKCELLGDCADDIQCDIGMTCRMDSEDQIYVCVCNESGQEEKCGDGETVRCCAGLGCVDTRSNDMNCGDCGKACESGEICKDGVCVVTCQTGQIYCNETCIDPMKDRKNCGACGKTCDAAEVCVNGQCSLSCQSGLTNCDGSCSDLLTDRYNCGACGVECPAGQVCDGHGQCSLSCQVGLVNCDGWCVNTTIDNGNCSACTESDVVGSDLYHICSSGNVCFESLCSKFCPSGTEKCNGRCVRLNSDNGNCGACGVTCTGGQVCIDGVCSDNCAAGEENCNGTCVNTQKDVKNCGACSSPEDPHFCDTTQGQSCRNGECIFSCSAGETSCSDGCHDLNIEKDNCGACGHACAETESCIDGVCEVPCDNGMRRCDGECTNLDNNNLHCGACGNACSASESCIGGSCSASCTSNYEICDGICTNLKNNPKHCGACGNQCGAGQVCDNGECSLKCASGKTNCEGICVDTNSDDANCGSCGVSCASHGKVCVSGECVMSCAKGLTKCLVGDSSYACVEPKTSLEYCGCSETAEGTPCVSSETEIGVCLNGSCIKSCNSAKGYYDCGMTSGMNCVNLKEDRHYCGKCNVSCSNNQICDNGACVEAECSESDFTSVCCGDIEDEEAKAKCENNNQLKTCKDGRFVMVACDETFGGCSAGSCNVCKGDTFETACDGRQLKKCQNGKFVLQACDENKTCKAGECVDAECKDTDAATCDDNNNVVKCVNGLYDKQSCGNKTCSAGACVESSQE